MCNAVKTLWRNIRCGHLFGHYRRSPELAARHVSGAGNAKWPRDVLRVTLIDNEKEIFEAVRKIFKAVCVPVEWDRQSLIALQDPMFVNPRLLNSAFETGLVLFVKEPNKTYSFELLALHKALGAFVVERTFNSIKGYDQYGPVNLINIADNVSECYEFERHVTHEDELLNIKTVSKESIMEVARVAFICARKRNHSQITVLHKADVMRLSDGMFLEACREVRARYPDVKYNEEKVDSFALNVTTNPDQYDVLLTTSLYGTFTGTVCGTMSGGLFMVPTISYGPKASVFSAMSDSGYSTYVRYNDGGVPNSLQQRSEEERCINPTGIIRAAAWMLNYAGMAVPAYQIIEAVDYTLQSGVQTQDIGGYASCAEFTDEIIRNLRYIKY